MKTLFASMTDTRPNPDQAACGRATLLRSLTAGGEWLDGSLALPAMAARVVAIPANVARLRCVLVTLLGVVIFASGMAAYGQASDRPAGTVVGWGRQVMPYVEPGTLFRAIAAGAQYSLALKVDGTVVAWGINDSGESVVPSGLTGVVAIAAGGYLGCLGHSLALKSDGTVIGWGNNWVGQTTVPENLSGVTAIAAGGGNSLALKSAGTVAAWGQLTPHAAVPVDLSGVTAIATGGSHSLALKSDRTVVAWGGNCFGMTNVPKNLSGVTAIAAGGCHSLALKSDGTVVAWGDNSNGQTNVPPNLSGVVAIAAGGCDGGPCEVHGHSLALKSDGTVVAWGDNRAGQTDVPAALIGVVAIAAGAFHSLALKSDGPLSSVQIVTHPFGQTVPGGTPVQLSVAAVGAGPLHYQWQFAAVRQVAQDLPGATSSTFVIPAATAAEAGQYSVRVWNATSSALSRPAYLSVLASGANGVAAVQIASPTTVTKLPGKTSLIIVTHGWDNKWRNLVPNNPPPVMADWVTDLANAIGTRVPSGWQVVALDWMLDAWKFDPDVALWAGGNKGSLLGKALAGQSWEHVHLIGHSAGANLIDAAACEIKRFAPSTVVHCTFLDPYLSSVQLGDIVYGSKADWADSYYTAKDITGASTGRPLRHAHNEEVSWRDPDHGTISYYTGLPYFGTYRLVEEATSSHGWPHDFYLDTVTNTAPDACVGGVGFPLSKEGGHWNDRGLYPINNQPVPLCGVAPVVLQQPIPGISNPFYQVETMLKATSGLVSSSGGGFNMCKPGTPQNSPQRQPKSDGNSVWLAVAVAVTNVINFVEFEAGFTGTGRGQGLMTVYWNTNQIGMVDERVAETGFRLYRFPLPAKLTEGLYTLSFQLDSFTNVDSVITVTNVATGFVGITEPLRLAVLPSGTNAFPLLQLTGAAGYNYMVESSTNLLNWQPQVLVVNSNGMTQFTDPGATNASQRFYRAVMP